jgi:transcriptional regulator with XRE-family HTH domain
MTREKTAKSPIVNVRVDIDFIRALMAKRGIGSQAELARLSGLTPQTISYVLDPKYRVNVSYQTLARIAAALGNDRYVNDMVIVEMDAQPSQPGQGEHNA